MGTKGVGDDRLETRQVVGMDRGPPFREADRLRARRKPVALRARGQDAHLSGNEVDGEGHRPRRIEGETDIGLACRHGLRLALLGGDLLDEADEPTGAPAGIALDPRNGAVPAGAGRGRLQTIVEGDGVRPPLRRLEKGRAKAGAVLRGQGFEQPLHGDGHARRWIVDPGQVHRVVEDARVRREVIDGGRGVGGEQRVPQRLLAFARAGDVDVEAVEMGRLAVGPVDDPDTGRRPPYGAAVEGHRAVFRDVIRRFGPEGCGTGRIDRRAVVRVDQRSPSLDLDHRRAGRQPVFPSRARQETDDARGDIDRKRNDLGGVEGEAEMLLGQMKLGPADRRDALARGDAAGMLPVVDPIHQRFPSGGGAG
jgi:hypothetical protein